MLFKAIYRMEKEVIAKSAPEGSKKRGRKAQYNAL